MRKPHLQSYTLDGYRSRDTTQPKVSSKPRQSTPASLSGLVETQAKGIPVFLIISASFDDGGIRTILVFVSRPYCAAIRASNTSSANAFATVCFLSYLGRA
jgi:hypothetical protein